MRGTGFFQSISGVLLALFLCASFVFAEPIVLEFSGQPAQNVDVIFERFNREHDDIKIVLVEGNESQILTRMAGGAGPDLYRVSWANFARVRLARMNVPM